jgi:hypothetical protein
MMVLGPETNKKKVKPVSLVEVIVLLTPYNPSSASCVLQGGAGNSLARPTS